MKQIPDIQFLLYDNIDRKLWDECVISSPNSLIYARSFYLDNICPGWCALAGNNYEWVTPVTNRRKWGISYLYQPPFTQQLGIFARPNIDPPVEEILNWLKKRFKFWEINWNYATNTDALVPPVQVTVATNFVLDLSKGYESIAANYKIDLIKNIKKARSLNLIYRSTDDYKKCIQLFKQYYHNRISHLQQRDYDSFEKICSFAAKHDMFLGREVLAADGNLMSIILLLNDGKRLYNLMNITTEIGRQAEANRFLLDSVIREFSGRDLLFDFEGSDLPGVKSFYKNFGGVNQSYFSLKYNALPGLLKLFKK